MSDHSTNNKRIAKNTLFLYMRTIIIMVVSLYTSRIVLQLLGESDFGIYNVVGSMVVLFSFMNYALSTATQRFLSFSIGQNDFKAVKNIFSMSLTSYFMVILIIVFLAETIGLWFVYNKMNIPSERMNAALWVYHTSIIVFCIKILRVPYQASIISYEKMSVYAYVSLVEAILSLGFVFLLFFITWDKLIFYSLTVLIVALIVNICYWIYCRRVFETCRYYIFWDKNLFNKLISFSGWSMLGGAANVASQQGLGIIVNIFTSVAVNAALGIASQVTSAVNSFVSNFQTAFVPQLVKTYSNGDKDYFHKLIMQSSRYSYYLIFVIGIPFIFFTKDILSIWLVSVPALSTQFTQLMLIYCMIDALSGPLWYSVQATGDIKRYQIVMTILILINLPVAYLILKLGYSPVYAILFRVVINFITHLVRIMFLNNMISFPIFIYFKEVMFNTLFITILDIPLIYYIHTHSSSNTINTILLFLLAIVINTVMVYTVGLRTNERRKINNYIKNKL